MQDVPTETPQSETTPTVVTKSAPMVKSIPTGRAKWLVPVVVCGLLVLPAVVLVMRHKTPPAAPAASVSPTIPMLEDAVRSNPSADNRLNLTQAYINANRQGSAIPILQGLLAQNPQNAQAWNNLCVARNMQSEFGEALEACRHAVAIAPEFQLAQNNLKWAQAQRQKALDAAAAASATAAASRTSQSYVDEGLNLLHAGEYDHALQVWQQAAAREPNNAIVVNDIGVAYMMKHMRAEAAVQFKKAMTLDPGMQIAKNNLAWAESPQ